MEYEMTTRSLNATQETKMISDISKLKKTMENAARYSQIEPEIKVLKGQRQKVWDKLQDIKTDEKVLVDEADGMREVFNEANKEKDGIKEQLDALQEQIEAIDKVIDELYKEKRVRTERFWEEKFHHKVQFQEIKHIEWLTKKKEDAKEAELEKLNLVAERADMLKNLDHPYLKEITSCDTLVNFCNQLRMKFGLIADSEEVARQVQTEMRKNEVKEKITEKINDGKIETTMNRAEKQAAAAALEAQRFKKKGKKQKKADQDYEEFTFDIGMIKNFANIKLNPPTSPEDLDDMVKKIGEKKQWFLDNGESKLQEQIEEIKRAQEEEDREFEEAKKQTKTATQRDDRGGRGGRGGYRGGRREDAPPRRGRGGYNKFGPKNDFDGDDEEDEPYRAPPVKRKQGAKKEDLALNDDNFPSFGGQ